MNIIRSFEPGDRYRYDFDLCTCAWGYPHAGHKRPVAAICRRTGLSFTAMWDRLGIEVAVKSNYR